MKTPLHIILLVVVGIVYVGCGRKGSASGLNVLPHAIVTKVDVSAPHPQVEIVGKVQFAKLISFFPNIREKRETNTAGGWEGKYSIVFHFEDRSQIKVTTSYDDENWSSGIGDKNLKPGLSGFLDPMFKKE